MKPGAGSRKGGVFERLVAKHLSLWISGGQRDDIFWRTSLSGGRSTIGLKYGINRSAQAGDIGAINSLGEQLLNHVVIDTKSYRDIQFMGGILNDRGLVYGWWRELDLHAAKFGKKPMLIVRQNNMPAVVMLTPPSCINLFQFTIDHVSAALPRWNANVILFDCFLREAAVPGLEARSEAKRRVLIA